MMSLSERFFDALTKFPAWLESFDALQIPGWTVLLAMAIAIVGCVIAAREFLSWFLKTNSIVDEVIRLENLVRDLQGDLTALEATVSRLQITTGQDTSAQIQATSNQPPDDALESLAQKETPAESTTSAKSKPQFRLDL